MDWFFVAIVVVFLFFLPIVVFTAVELLVTSKLQRKEKHIAVILAAILGSFGLHWLYLGPSKIRTVQSSEDYCGLPSFYISEFLLFFLYVFSLMLPDTVVVVFLLLFCFLIMVSLGIRDAVYLYNVSDESFDRTYNKKS